MNSIAWLTAYLVLLFAVPSTQIVGPLGSAGSLAMVFGLGSFMLWVMLRVAASRSTGSEPEPVRRALVVFLFCVGFTYTWTMSHPVSPDEVSPADVAVLALISWAGTFLLAHDSLDTLADLRTILRRIAMAGGFLAMLGLLQALTRQVWVDRVSIPGLTLTQAAGNFDRGGFPRPAGTSVHPIEFGVVIAVLFPIALHIAFHDKERPLWLRWFPAAAIGALVPLTSSRSAYLGVLVGLLICMTGWEARRRWQMLGLAGVGVVAMLVVTPNLLNSIVRLFTGAGEDASVSSRTGSFGLAGDFFERSPLIGRGLGTFLPKYRIFDNQYLLLIVTVGLIGTVAFLAVAVVAIRTLRRARAHTDDAATKDLTISLTASIVVGFLSLLLFDAFAFPQTMGTIFLVLGLAGAVHRLSAVDGARSGPDKSRSEMTR
ncbi:O-antigen ligase [Nocardioides alpinus]|uniref:O-antigen ligase n=1 Tax=Nocardioides alpinus TaxID=748909 RepID=A0A1I0VST6_9ACTN|nr:O-antigen ligase family protein [Nocardioides alpinus]PKH37458.1 O-antigen polymerase [Nocardioides alpinus]SFA79459.1 O-antigen ligase [Nocardioides alpinus]